MSCSCGREEPYERCCQPYIEGAAAPTAEALMRSRYSAYVHGATDYLVSTHAPEGREEVDRDLTEKWAKESSWLGLEVVSTDKGAADDDEGMVEFIARYRTAGHDLSHREKSRFKKVDGRWCYVDGEVARPQPARAAQTAGRNDPCPCGSGKKYKRCHG